MTDLELAALRPDEVRTTLREATANVLETMFFVSLAEEDPEPEGIWPAARYSVRIEFQGDRHGAFTIRVPDCMGSTIAANFLARDESEIVESEAEEVVREFANMVCGATLSAVAPRATLDLSPPSGQAGVPPEGEVYSDSLVCDCGRMEMQLEFWSNE